MDAKHFIQSKTLWTNIVAILASFAAKQLGFDIDANAQIAILGVLNLVLRAVTKSALTIT